MKRTLLAVGISVSALGGCSSSPPPPTLAVSTVAAATSVAGNPAPLGRYLLEVTVKLDNVGTSPVSGWWYDYALATENSLALTPSTISNLVANPCSADTDLLPGATFECTLVFDLPCGDLPVGVSYEGSATTAVIDPTSVTQPTKCGEAPDAGTDSG